MDIVKKEVDLGIPCFYNSKSYYRQRIFSDIIFNDYTDKEYQIMKGVYDLYRKRLKNK